MGASSDYGVHNSNRENGKRAVLERVFFVKGPSGFQRPPKPLPGIFKRRLQKFRKHLLRYCVSTPPDTEFQFLSYYQGRKRMIYERAIDSLHVQEVERKDAFLSAFVKAEKINFTEKLDPAPRLIQPRSPRYNVRVGQYIKPIEHPIYRAIDRSFGAHVVAKGKNAVERGAMLREAWDSLSDPVAVFLDASRFDQHVSKEALEWEHSVYLAVHQGDPVLQRLLSWQLVNRGFLYCDDGSVKYSVTGCRASGDMNTALGNVLIMCGLMSQFLQEWGGPGARLVNDGDDCVVLVERRMLTTVKAMAQQWFLDFGFTMKIEGDTDVFEKIEFCGSQPVFDGEKWVMVRNPHTTLDKDMVSVKPINDQPTWARQCQNISDCGLALAGNIPVFCSFYDMLSQGIDTPRQLETGMDYLALGMEGKRRVPSEAARTSFFMAFDITPDEQVALEEFYDSVTPRWRECGAPRDNTDKETHNALY